MCYTDKLCKCGKRTGLKLSASAVAKQALNISYFQSLSKHSEHEVKDLSLGIIPIVAPSNQPARPFVFLS